MTNKIIAVLLGLMLLTVMPTVLAEDTNIDANINTIDEKEAQSILAPFGAEVRMLQLEKAVTRNILHGDIVLNVLNKNHAAANLTEAENTLNTLEMLLEEIKSSPTEGDKNILVQTFVELKKEARTLSKNFRDQTKDIIDTEDRNEIMTQMRELDKNEFKNITNIIKEKVKNFNREKMKEKFKEMGIENPQLLERFGRGDSDLNEVKNYAMNRFKDMNMDKKKSIANKMKNDSIKNLIESKQITEKIKQTLEQKLRNNMQNRMENLNEWIERKALDANTNGRFNRADRLNDQSQRIENMIQRMDDRNGGKRK
jgi:hypothetical protein